MAVPKDEVIRNFNARRGLSGSPRIAFAARFAAEKGVEHLLQALPIMLKEIPSLKIIFSGAHAGTVGEEQYLASLQPMIDR